jgi:hypothetical protein
VVTSLGSENVAEDVDENGVLRNQTMCFAIVALVPEYIELCWLIIRYGPLSDDLRPMKVIVSRSKYSGELREMQIE